jgi:uncharacterized zinc-type alcohol dehydrogenase-like protein
VLQILYCGICHSDIHQARNEWGSSIYPMVPGHEVVGRVARVGSSVGKVKLGDIVGVGCFVDSCRSCPSCQEGLEQYCEGHLVLTYNGTEKDRTTPTFGGYSDTMVVDENYLLRVTEAERLEAVAPLLCAGITTYSPLRHVGVGKGDRLGVIGLGGLGHMAVKLGRSFGAEVTVISTSPSKATDAARLGAHQFVARNDDAEMARQQGKLDYLIDTVAAPHDLAPYLELLRRDGTLMMVGAPDKPLSLPVFPLILKRRKILGSLIGGIRETQEMLDYCAAHRIVSEVETIGVDQINEAYTRTIKGDVRYRFVIDMKSLSR